MTTRTATRRLLSTYLREDIARGHVDRVDRAAGVIYGVKVVGAESGNTHGMAGATKGTRYTPEALQRAIGLYENAHVYANHPPRSQPLAERKIGEKMGWLKNVRIKEGELYADLHVLLSHEDAPAVLEAAERNPELFGMSHNANGRGEVKDGWFVIHEIPEVKSVDVVSDPATNSSLFESRSHMKPVKSILEAKVLPKLRKAAAKRLKALLEGMGDDAKMEEGDDSEDHRDHLFSAYKACSESDPEMGNKILGMLKNKKDDDDEDAKESEEDDDEKDTKESEDDDDDKDAKESRKARRSADPTVKQLREEMDARDLVEDAGLTFATPKARKAFTRSLIGLSESDRKDVIEDRKAQQKQAGNGKPPAPRSQAPGRTVAVAEAKIPEKAADWAASLIE